jgi:hypothetical protein
MARLPSANESIAPLDQTAAETGTPSPTPAADEKHSAERFARLFRGFELAMVPIVLALGFLLASFAIRNSDFWMHLATGRYIAHGNWNVFFGQDPFSCATAGRHWVNTAWLFDLMLYAVYSLDPSGAGLVIVKGVLVALLAGVMLLACRPAPSERITPGSKADLTGWLAAIAVGLALVACAPRLILHPFFVSLLFTGLSFRLLNSQRDSATQWGLPVAMGVLCALWANLDEWFLLGPIMVVLFLVGEILESVLPGAAVRPVLPGRVKILALTLIVALAACLLNPHHVRVFQLPNEFAGGDLDPAFKAESPIKYQFMGFFEAEYRDEARQGAKNIPGLCFLILTALGLIGIVMNLTHLRWSLLLTWVAFLALPILRGSTAPLFAVIAAPVAVQLIHAWFARRPERAAAQPDPEAASLTEAQGGIALTASGVTSFLGLMGRLFTIVLGLVALAAAYPGWLHRPARGAGDDRHVAWKIEPHPALKEMAERIGQWQHDGRLPADARGYYFRPELAHYCAWFAPGERGFFDYRYNLLGDLSADHMRVRRGLKETGESRSTADDWASVLRRHQVTHVVIANPGLRDNGPILRLFFIDDRQWALWYQNGLTAIFGWHDPDQAAAPDRLRLDLGRMAFGAGSERLAAPKEGAVVTTSEGDEPHKRELLDKFLHPPNLTPHEPEAVLLYLRMRDGALQRQFQNSGFAVSVGLEVGDIGLASAGPQALFTPNPMRHPNFLTRLAQLLATQSEIPNALGLLAVREAHRGIANHPDNAFSYLLLAQAYDAFPPVVQGLRFKQFISAVHQGLDRLTGEDLDNPSMQVLVRDDCLRLYEMHRNQMQQMGRPPQLDLAEEALGKALDAMKRLASDSDTPGQIEAVEKELEQMHKEVETRRNRFIVQSEKYPATVKAGMALGLGLVRDAVKLMEDDPSSLNRDALLALAELYPWLGRPASSDPILDQLAENANEKEKIQVNRMRIESAALAGDFARAAKQMDDMFAGFAQGRDGPDINYSVAVTLQFLFTDAQSFTPLSRVLSWMALAGPQSQILSQQYRWAFSLLRLYGVTQQVTDFHAMRGVLALEEGDTATARAQLQEALEPQKGPTFYFLGRANAVRYLEFLKHNAPK